MVATAAPNVSGTGFFKGTTAVPRFNGTIIISRAGQGDRGRYWQLVVLNEKTGRLEKMSSISDSDPDSLSYYKSNKYKMVQALIKAGVTDIEDRAIEDFEGLRFEFEVLIKENSGGFQPTTLFIPRTMLESADAATVREQQERWTARVGGAAVAPRVNAPAPVVSFSYTPEQLEQAAELLDGTHSSNVVSAAMRATDPGVQQGIFNGTIIEQAKAVGLLDQDDDGTYRQATLS